MAKGPQLEKQVPIRTCIATGKKLPKQEMIRLVRQDPDLDSIVVDVKGKLKGRGANLEKSLDSFDIAVKKRAIERALKLDKPIGADQLATLREQFALAIAEKDFRQGNKKVVLKISKEEFNSKLLPR